MRLFLNNDKGLCDLIHASCYCSGENDEWLSLDLKGSW